MIRKRLRRRGKAMSKLHGFFSLFLIFLAIVIGLVSLSFESFSAALLYGVIILVSLSTIMYSFCSKCLCRLEACGHVLPGKLTKLFPSRAQGDYTMWDISGLVLPFIILLAFPQISLWKNWKVWAVFWLLICAGAADARMFVCTACRNEKCPIHGQQKVQ